jgi:hypothetical protein
VTVKSRRNQPTNTTLAVPAPRMELGEAGASNREVMERLTVESEQRLAGVVSLLRSEVDTMWRPWRSGDLLGSPQGEHAPDLGIVDVASGVLDQDPFELEDGRSVGGHDPLVRELLSEPSSSGPPLDAEYLDLLAEWHAYADRHTAFLDAFCVEVPELDHQLDVHLHWERELSAGASPAGLCTSLGFVEADAGGCAGGGVELAQLTFSYRNETTGFAWSGSYLKGQVKAFAGGGANLEFLPILFGTSDEGDSSLCNGSLTDELDRFVGPLALETTTYEGALGVGMGVGIDLEDTLASKAGGVGRLIVETSRGDLTFDTSGECGLSKTMGIGGDAELKGAMGRMTRTPFSDLEVTPSGPAPSSVEADAVGKSECAAPEEEDREEVLLRASLYFPRGSTEVYGHLDNTLVVGQVALGLVNESMNHGAPAGCRIEVTGHASPAWEAATSDEQRVSNNDALGLARAEATVDALRSVVENAGIGWPQASYEPTGRELPAPEVSSMGAGESAAATGDVDAAPAEAQRADVVVYVTRRRPVRDLMPQGAQ